MNQERFDELAQAFATNSISRRQALKTLAANLILGMLPVFGGARHAEAQTVCTEVGSRCRKNSECCSNICSRKQRCQCKNSGQSCSVPRNCCSENCCNGRCCNDKQTCENGRCVCDELYEQCGSTCCNPLTQECRNGVCCTPCGSACCNPLTQECQNGVCCKQVGVACSRGSQCCSGVCKDGRCRPETCQFHGDCSRYPREKCCQGRCVTCPDAGATECTTDGTCGCPGDYWCPPGTTLSPHGACCGDTSPNVRACCNPNSTQCSFADPSGPCPPGSTEAKLWPQQ